MVKPAQVADGVILFAETELLPALGGWQLWVAGAALALLRPRVDKVLDSLTTNKIVSALGLVDADGMIDTPAAAEALKESIRKHGKLPLDIPLLGSAYKFSEKDIDALLGFIEKSGA